MPELKTGSGPQCSGDKTRGHIEVSSSLPLLPIRDTFFSPSTLSYAGFSCFHKPVHELKEPLPQSHHFLPHLLYHHHHILRSFGSPSVHFFSFLSVYLSITWLQQFDSQSQPRRAFLVILLLTSQSPLPHLLSPLLLISVLYSHQSAWG